MIIAIDGPAGSGKGTVAKMLSTELNLAYLDTGMLYRGVARVAIDTKISLYDSDRLEDIAQNLHPDQLIDNPLLRTEDVSDGASKVASIQSVREALFDFQRNYANNPPEGKSGAVLDGRDIGTKICPDADHKFFLTASLEARAKRRFLQLQSVDKSVMYEDVLEDLQHRDARDATRTQSPLKAAKDAEIIDTSFMTASQVFANIMDKIKV